MIVHKHGGQKRSRGTHLRSGRPSCQKMGSPKCSSYSEEFNSDDIRARIIYPLHYTGVKFMKLKNTFGIKYATKNHIPGAYISTMTLILSTHTSLKHIG